jgi:hypothetical protein
MVMANSSRETNIELSEHGRRYIREVLRRAAEDAEFRESLLNDPQQILGTESGLSSDEKTLLFSMRRVALEEAGFEIADLRSWLRDNGAFASHAE